MHYVNANQRRIDLERKVLEFYDTYSWNHQNSNPKKLAELIERGKKLGISLRKYKLTKKDAKYPWSLSLSLSRDEFIALKKSISLETLEDLSTSFEEADLKNDRSFKTCATNCASCRRIIKEAEMRGGKPLSKAQKRKIGYIMCSPKGNSKKKTSFPK